MTALCLDGGIKLGLLLCLHRERNIPEIFSMYEVTFAKLSERFFKGTTWPPVEYIAELVDKDSVFCLLYKVLAQQCQHGLVNGISAMLALENAHAASFAEMYCYYCCNLSWHHMQGERAGSWRACAACTASMVATLSKHTPQCYCA